MLRQPHLLSIVVWLLDDVLGMNCLGNTGTYVINVKIYTDETSVITIGKYMEKLINKTHSNLQKLHNMMKKRNISEFELYTAYTKQYIGLLFDLVNAQLLDTNVQVEADFSEMLMGEYTNLQAKYCRIGSNITMITEEFMNETPLAGADGHNRMLIINCHGNLASYPRLSHTATKNMCGRTLGISLSEPSALRTTITESIYQIFIQSTPIDNLNAHLRLVSNACAYIHYCNKKYPEIGKFISNLRSLGSPAELHSLEYNKGRVFTDDFPWGNTADTYPTAVLSS